MRRNNTFISSLFAVICLVAEFVGLVIFGMAGSWFSLVMILLIVKNIWLLHSAYKESDKSDSDEKTDNRDPIVGNEKNTQESSKDQKYSHFGQGENPYYKKRFSILGDSISTLEGYNPRGYSVFYTAEKCRIAGVHGVHDTWWGKVIEFLGGELLVNNSWSGSRVTMMPSGSVDHLFPAGMSEERTSGLHIGNVKPDVIIVNIGVNDWANGVTVDCVKEECTSYEYYTSFSGAYEDMLVKLKKNYPQSEIWCCTLCETVISEKPSFKFPRSYKGIDIGKYNEVIYHTAREQGCKVIDLCAPYDSLDGTHPNAAGMNTIAMMILRSVEGKAEAQFPEWDEDDLNKIIDGKYRILKCINRSSLVSDYLAMNERINRECAVKVYDNSGKNSAIKDIIMNESLAMIKLNHPAIPKIYDIVEDKGRIFIIREYVQGEALDTILKNNGAQPVDRVLDWSRQLCDVLKYLHNLNPPHIYRDMKPANIVIQPDGRVKLIAFETMHKYDTNKDSDAIILGTRGYAAPEQYGGAGQTDARADIFGLGMTMHYMLTGVNPVEPPYMTQPIRKINPNLPVQLERIIQKCIEPNRENRYQSVDELLRALDVIVEPTAPQS